MHEDWCSTDWWHVHVQWNLSVVVDTIVLHCGYHWIVLVSLLIRAWAECYSNHLVCLCVTRYSLKTAFFRMKQCSNGKNTYYSVNRMCMNSCKNHFVSEKKQWEVVFSVFWSIAILKFSQSHLVTNDVCWHCKIILEPNFACRFF